MSSLTLIFVFAIMAVLSAGRSNTADLFLFFTTLTMAFFLLTKDRKLFRFSGSIKVLFLLILFHIWSLSVSVVNSVSFLTSYQFWAYSGIALIFSFLASFYLAGVRERKTFVNGLVLLGGLLSVANLIYLTFGIKLPQGDLSLMFPTYGHSRFAEFFLPLLPISVYLFLDSKNSHRLIRGAAALSIFNFFLAFSRASLVSILFFPAIAAALKIYAGRVNKRVVVITTGVCVLMLLIFTPVWIFSTGFKPGVHPLRYIIDKPMTIKDRMIFFADAFSKWRSSRLTGYGPGTYSYVADNRWVDTRSTTFVHNHVLQTLYESGLLGILSEGFLLGWVLVAAVRNTGGAREKLLLSGVMLSFIQGNLDFGWEIPIVSLVCLTILISLGQAKKEDVKTKERVSLPVSFFLVIFTGLLMSLYMWKVSSWATTNQTFEKRVASGSRKAISDWLKLERGNGEVHKWLYQYYLDDGVFDKSFFHLLASWRSPYRQNELSIDDLAPFLEKIAKNPEILPVGDRYKLLEEIEGYYFPHNFFRIRSDETKSAIISIVDGLLSSTDALSFDGPMRAKLSYWKYTELLMMGRRNYRDYKKYLVGEYSWISDINKALSQEDERELLRQASLLLRSLPVGERPVIKIGLLDHIYMKLGDIYMVKGNYSEEIRYRKKALEGTQTATFYLLLAKRLETLGKKAEAMVVISECEKLYPNCSSIR